MARKPRIGLALGSGSARGWAHIGAIHALEERGIKADIVCGASIGALVGAAYASGQLDRLEQWVTGLAWTKVVRLMDLTWKGGLIRGARLFTLFGTIFEERNIEDLPIPYGAIATELYSGREVWLRHGKVLEAVRASCAMPGLFTPVVRDNVVLVDGGLVNPVPVSMCRALGADLVIAVDLSWGKLGAYRGRPRGRAARRPRMAGALDTQEGQAGRGGPADHPLHLRGVQHLARRGGKPRRQEPPVGRSGRRAAYTAASGLRHHGLSPREGGD
jgi:NTE family protein